MNVWARFGLDLPPLPRGRQGDPGLFGPGSMVWRVGRERVLVAGGAAALLMQLAHPLVAAGVADHSRFRGDPFGRLRTTLDATLRIAFGDSAQAEEAAEQVRRTHSRVRGALRSSAGPYPKGTPYRADDPELALWVHATLVWSALEAYGRFVRPLDLEERSSYYQEAKRFSALFGVTDDVAPPTYRDFEAYFATALQTLWVGEAAREMARLVLDPPVPRPFRPVVRGVRLWTAALLPERIRTAFWLRWGSDEPGVFQRRFVHLAVRSTPPRLRYWPHYRVAVGRTR